VTVTAYTVMLRGRLAAEALMVDACTITRTTGSTTDPETGQDAKTTVTVYSGKCRFQQAAAGASGQNVGEANIYQVAHMVQLPMSVTGVRVEDIVTATVSIDPDLVGRKFWVRAVAEGTHKTARRLPIELVTG
jgi:hypothetical protein